MIIPTVPSVSEINMRAFWNFMVEMFVLGVLCKRNIAWIDPVCGCPRSPDVRLSEPCPDPLHSRSTHSAFATLDQPYTSDFASV